MLRLATLALAGLVLAGCANQLLSNERIRDNTAMALGLPASSVVISDRRYDGATNTYYNASTPQGAYHCVINGGSIIAFGMTNPPQCAPQGQVLRAGFPSVGQ